MEKTFTKGFKSPDETRKFKSHGPLDILKFGDAFHMPPGHDAWTEGKETCVLIDVTGVNNYAKPA